MSDSVYKEKWNTTDNDLYDQYFAKEYEKYDRFFTVVLILEFLLALIGIIANSTICGVLLRKKRILKNFSNFQLFNLALTDIIFRLALTPVLVTIENKEVKDGSNAVCKLGAFGSYTTLAVTFMLLLGIAFDRYFHIVHPIKARYITWKHSRNAVIFSWIYGAACSSPFLFSMKYTKVDLNASTDYEYCASSLGLPFQISSSVFLFFAFIVPLSLMTVAYSKILKVLWQRARNKVINSQVAKAKLSAVKMMVAVVVAYVISWGPKLIWVCLQAFEKVSLAYTVDWESEEISLEEKIEDERKYITLLIIDDIMDLFTFTSSILNSLIFGYYNKSFREELKNCCRLNRLKCCKKGDAETKSRKKMAQRNVIVFEDTTITATRNVFCVMGDKGKISQNVSLPEDKTKIREYFEEVTKL